MRAEGKWCMSQYILGGSGRGGFSRGTEGGPVGAVGCSIGAVVRSRRMSRVVGVLWEAVGAAGSRMCGALALGARECWRVWIGIGEAFSGFGTVCRVGDARRLS